MPRPSSPDAYTHDLLGDPIPPPTHFRKDGVRRKIGYADRPGTGPKGERCGTCLHLQRCVHLGNTTHKCEIMAAIWNYSTDTDVHLQAPACSHWVRRPFERILKLKY
jgi:hypothetical protein